MKLNDVWSRLVSRSQSSSPTNNFDKQLLRQVGLPRVPRWSQLKYIRQFLSPLEWRVAAGALAVIIVTSIAAVSIFVSRHYRPIAAEGGEYQEVVVGQPTYPNPLFSTANETDADMSQLMYAGLLTYDEYGVLVPELAEKMELSDDRKTYTLTLKANLHWSDGEPLTANDVAYTIKSIQNVEVNSPLLPAWQGVLVSVVDEWHVTITLKEPFVPFPHSLTVGIIPEHIWSQIDPANFRLAKFNLQPVGSGPWKFSRLVKDENGKIKSYVLARNEAYSGTKPFIRTLSFSFVDDYDAALLEMRNQKQAGMSFVPLSLMERLPTAQLTTYSLRLPQYVGLFFNQTNLVLLKDPGLRRNLGRGLDRSQIIAQALKGAGVAINHPLPSKAGYDPDTAPDSFDAERANTELDQNFPRVSAEEYIALRRAALLKNYQEETRTIQDHTSSTPQMVSSTMERINSEVSAQLDQEMAAKPPQSFFRTTKDHTPLMITLTTLDNSEYGAVAEDIAKQWRRLGLVTLLQRVTPRQMVREVLKERKYQVLLYGELLGVDPDLFSFWHSSQTEYPGLNLALFVNRTADKLLEEARTAATAAERQEYYKKFQAILDTELPAIFLYAPIHHLAVSTNIKGVALPEILSAPPERYALLNRWYIKTHRQWKW